jgi:hypothetical protein
MGDYQHKYNKYKTKYLMLKMQQNISQSGGVVSLNDKMILPMAEFIDSVNVVCRESLCCYNDCINNHKQLIKILTICNQRKINVSKFVTFRTIDEKIVNVNFDFNNLLNYLVFVVSLYEKIKNVIEEFYKPENKPPEKEKILSDCYANYMKYYDKFVKQFCGNYESMFSQILVYIKSHKMPYVSIVVRKRNTETTFDGTQNTLCDGSFINDCVLFLAAQKMPRIEMPLNVIINTTTADYNKLFDAITERQGIPETEYENIKTIPEKTEWLTKYINKNVQAIQQTIQQVTQATQQTTQRAPQRVIRQEPQGAIRHTIHDLKHLQQLSQIIKNLSETRKMILNIAGHINEIKRELEKHNTELFGINPITLHMSQFGDDLQLHFSEIQHCNKSNVGNCKLPCEVKNGTCNYSTLDEIKESYKMADGMIAFKREDCKKKMPTTKLPTDGSGPCGDTNCFVDKSSAFPSCKYKEEMGIETKKKLGEYIGNVEKSATKPKSKWGFVNIKK